MSNNAVEQNIREYLAELKAALAGQDAALIQDALYDAESHFRAALEEAGDGAASMPEIIKSYGSPEEIAERYCEMELTVNLAFHGVSRPGDTAKPGSLFSIFKDMAAYRALIYFFISFPLSIAYSAWTLLVGLTSAAASLLLVGIPALVFFAHSMRYFSLLEGRLIETLLDVRMPRRPNSVAESNKGLSMARVMKAVLCRKNWTTGLYLTLQFPLAVLYLAVIIGPALLGVVLFLSPMVDPLLHALYPALKVDINWYWLPLTTVLSAGLLLLSLSLAKLAGRFHGRFAKAMLVSV